MSRVQCDKALTVSSGILQLQPCNQNTQTHKSNTNLLRQESQDTEHRVSVSESKNYTSAFKMKTLLCNVCCTRVQLCFSPGDWAGSETEEMRQKLLFFFCPKKDGKGRCTLGVRVMERSREKDKPEEEGTRWEG